MSESENVLPSFRTCPVLSKFGVDEEYKNPEERMELEARFFILSIVLKQFIEHVECNAGSNETVKGKKKTFRGYFWLWDLSLGLSSFSQL